MLEEFREQADSADFSEEAGEETFEEVAPTRPASNFLGMTPLQRLVIAVMLLMIVCVLGTFFLIATDRIVLPVF
jgi:hypothetical protein